MLPPIVTWNRRSQNSRRKKDGLTPAIDGLKREKRRDDVQQKSDVCPTSACFTSKLTSFVHLALASRALFTPCPSYAFRSSKLQRRKADQHVSPRVFPYAHRVASISVEKYRPIFPRPYGSDQQARLKPGGHPYSCLGSIRSFNVRSRESSRKAQRSNIHSFRGAAF